MRVLLVESTPGNATAVKRWLAEAGHETTTCFESPVTFGCKGVERHEDCPLERATDLAVLVRDLDGGNHSLTEMGAVCAMRHRVPVVEVVEPGQNDLDSTLLAALAEAESAAASRGYVDAVRASLAEATTLADPDRIGITVTRSTDRVQATVDLPGDVVEHQVPMVVDCVSRALRRYDQYAKVIDVGVTRGA